MAAAPLPRRDQHGVREGGAAVGCSVRPAGRLAAARPAGWLAGARRADPWRTSRTPEAVLGFMVRSKHDEEITAGACVGKVGGGGGREGQVYGADVRHAARPLRCRGNLNFPASCFSQCGAPRGFEGSPGGSTGGLRCRCPDAAPPLTPSS